MKNPLTAIVIIHIALTGLTYAQSMPAFPSGWKPATKTDFSDENLSFNRDRVPNHIEADFNGDSIRDHAWILINSSRTAYGLFLFLGIDNGSYETIQLDEHNMETVKLFTGISLLEAGQYQTACGKGHWACKKDEPEILRLSTPGINYYAFEGANSVFYWNSSNHKFIRTWLSD